MANTKQAASLTVKRIALTKIKPAKYNPRVIEDKNFEGLVASLRDFGQRENLVVNSDMTLISGHKRLKVMVERLGWTHAMFDVVDLDKVREKQLNLILNNPLLQGKFDMKKLPSLLEELRLSPNMADYRLPELGKLELRPSAGKLSDRFVVAPFSVLNTTSGEWQRRKAAWQAKSGDSAESREAAQAYDRKNSPGYMADAMAAAGGGTSVFDPVLAEVICRWFGVPGGSVFDPFAGGMFGYVAGSLGMQFTGIEIRPEQAKLNQQRVDKDKLPAKFICDDGLNMDKHIKPASQDLIFSCPPYADLEHYSDLPGDLSNMGTADFFKSYKKALANTYKLLKPNRFAVLVVGEVRDKSGGYLGLVPQTIAAMQEAGYTYYNELILVNAVGTLRLRVRRQMRTRKVGRMHQTVLVFYKGDPKAIKNEYPELKELVENEAAT